MELVPKIKQDKKMSKNRNLKYGGYAAVVTAFVIAGLIVVNLIVNRLGVSFDITRNRLFTLSDQTKKIVANLEDDITIYAFFRTGKESRTILEVIKKYTSISNKITYKQVDPDINPGFAIRYDKEKTGIAVGSIIVEKGSKFKVLKLKEFYNYIKNSTGQREKVSHSIEQRLTSAINFVISDSIPKIYELSGHRETSLKTLGLYRRVLNENYEISDLNLMRDRGVPEDASLVVCIGPRYDLNNDELVYLKTYLENGGKMLFLLDILSEYPIGFNLLLRSYGIVQEVGVVAEANKENYYKYPVVLIPNMGDHEIVNPLKEKKLKVILDTSAPLRILDVVKREIEVNPILTSSSTSWVNTNLADLNSGFPGKGGHIGPFVLGAAINKRGKEKEKGFRIVVIGNFRFMKTEYEINRDFFLNTLSWLNSRQETISIRAKSIYKMPLTMNDMEVTVYAVVIVVILPLMILGIGLFIWLRRRHL